MKRKVIIISGIIVSILIMLFIGCKYMNNRKKGEIPQKIETLQIVLGEKFIYVDELKEKYILDYKFIDIDNDKYKEDIVLVGEKEKVSDFFSKNMCIVIRNGKNGQYNIYQIEEQQGYESHIKLIDVTNDGILDIVLSSKLGRKENAISVTILKYEKNVFTKIFGMEESEGISVSGEYLDNYQVKIVLNKYNKEFVADILDKKEYYEKNNIYNEKEKLLKNNINIKCNKINMLEQTIIEEGNFGIRTVQKIIGIDKTDIIDIIETKWMYKNNRFVIFEIIGKRCGRLL